MLITGFQCFCQDADGNEADGEQDAVDVVPGGEAFLVEVLPDEVNELLHIR